MPKKRIGYIDALRGLTMILVVYSHIAYHSYNVSFIHSIFGLTFVHFRMPMFFFISGFITYKASPFDGKQIINIIKNKFLIQIIPTIVFFHLLYVACQQKPIDTLLISGFGGYWFTIVLFYFFIIYYACRFISQKTEAKYQDIPLIILAVTSCIIYWIGIRRNNPNFGISHILCIDYILRYFPYFALGIMCRKYQNHFFNIINKDSVKTILIIIFVICSIIAWHNRYIKDNIFITINYEYIVRYIGLFLVFSIFYNYREYFEQDKIVPKALIYIGKNTLSIYLLHYFFLPKLNIMHDIAMQNKMIALELVLTLSLSCIIIAITLITSKIISSSKFLGYHLLGIRE